MIHFLTLGIILGLSAGFAPGPLLTLVISETLQHGIRAGIKVSLAPVITDLPIIILTLFILSELSSFHTVLGLISLAGACFILLMGYQSIRINGVKLELQEVAQNSLMKGILANSLSPHPYLFWISVGGPIMSRANSLSIGAALAFIISFYVLLLGSKVFLAVVVGKSRAFLNGAAYLYIMRLLGVALCVLALFLFHDGLKLLKLI